VCVCVCVCVCVQIYTMMWAARLGVPLVFKAIKMGMAEIFGGARWAILKKKLDWYPHHMALKRFKSDTVRISVFCCVFCENVVVTMLLPASPPHLFPFTFLSSPALLNLKTYVY